MKNIFLLLIAIFGTITLSAQTDSSSKVLTGKETKKLMKELSKQVDVEEMNREALENSVTRACKCIDSVRKESLSQRDYTAGASYCIKEEASSLNLMNQLTQAMFDLEKPKKKKDKVVNINISDGNSKKYYYQIERALMDSCTSLKSIMTSNDDVSEKSISDNQGSRYHYNLGEKAFANKNYDEAIKEYKQAVEIDSNFAFAWDNLGLSYRYKGDYIQAIRCYEKSLRIEPNGTMPLHNIPVAYEYLKEYEKAIVAYQNLIELYPEDPEGYFGKGRMFLLQSDDEKGLDFMCKAYNLYTAQKNPYRADAEKLMGAIYAEMSKTAKGKKRFEEILEENKISLAKEKKK